MLPDGQSVFLMSFFLHLLHFETRFVLFRLFHFECTGTDHPVDRTRVTSTGSGTWRRSPVRGALQLRHPGASGGLTWPAAQTEAHTRGTTLCGADMAPASCERVKVMYPAVGADAPEADAPEADAPEEEITSVGAGRC